MRGAVLLLCGLVAGCVTSVPNPDTLACTAATGSTDAVLVACTGAIASGKLHGKLLADYDTAIGLDPTGAMDI